jgi:hypothetical protein
MAGIKAGEVRPRRRGDTTGFAVNLLKNTYMGENTVVPRVGLSGARDDGQRRGG